ncbi:hypothetical protein LEN26_000472 [Aphanomyces euteiches]|nr:hypothetical protein AeMF1_000768 [Aphanomyces euteiches]KAH9163480.1 hypothetical protein LEN26_000472 [Aphanomyces euteiches]KAH9193307.1 hypothetical protein AeNC1_004707 [Aphanomyces euteiches]
MIADTQTILAYSIQALKSVLPNDSNLLELERLISDVKAQQQPKESILFSGTRLRCEELEAKLDLLMAKLMEKEYPFRDDVYDAMSLICQHEQLLCDLEEYLEADLPAKEHFLVHNCALMRTRIRVMSNFLKARLESAFDETAQTDHVMGPYRRNLAHAKKSLRFLHQRMFSLTPNELENKMEALDEMIAHAEEHDFNFDPTAFNFGRDALDREKTRLVDEWKLLMRDLRSIKRALKGLSPVPTSLLVSPPSPSPLLL